MKTFSSPQPHNYQYLPIDLLRLQEGVTRFKLLLQHFRDFIQKGENLFLTVAMQIQILRMTFCHF